MENREIKPESPIPLYYQLITILLDEIQSGEIKPNEAIPTEQELKDKYGISRTTIRKAISELTHANILESRHAKGIYVKKENPEEISTGFLTSFTEEFINRGDDPTSRIEDFSIIIADEYLAKKLEIPIGADVFIIKRLRLLNGIPRTISYAYVPKIVAPNLRKEDFATKGIEQSLYYIIQNLHGVEINSALEEISAILLTDEEATLLRRQSNSPNVVRYRQVFDPNGSVILFERAVLAYSYRTRLARHKQDFPPYTSISKGILNYQN